jgi:hypothetical protein
MDASTFLDIGQQFGVVQYINSGLLVKKDPRLGIESLFTRNENSRFESASKSL